MGFYLLCALLGMLIFAQFYNCDPVHAKVDTMQINYKFMSNSLIDWLHLFS